MLAGKNTPTPRKPRPRTETCTPTNPNTVPGFTDFGHMNLQGVCNARDLGGMPAAKGKHIAKRRLMRSGDLHDATSSDVSQLIDMHDMECIVDFRTDSEVESKPDPKPLLHGIEYRHLPVLPQSAIVSVSKGHVTGDARLAKEFRNHPFETITGLYTKAILGELGMNAYKEFLHGLLRHTQGATLWHCTQGKDRTGIAAILVEYCLGVPMEYIHDDYLATNLFIGGWIERMQRFLSDKPFARGLDSDIEAYAYASDCYFDAAFEAINGVFGGIENYLDKILDFGPAKRAQLQEMYLV